ncbi:MAG: FecR family protein [Deltaproteobacteria bacterium]|nr:FecR family protein [Deltaproteobacteria bacterium]
MIFFTLSIFSVLLLSSTHLKAEDGSIGKVTGLLGDAVIVRGDGEIQIVVGAEIRLSDSVRTGSDGRVRILFTDDGVASVGPGALFRMDEYQDSGSERSFKAHVAEGLVRFVTGKIVEANPDGFSVTAPEAVVGIRGTIISVRAEKEKTTVYVEKSAGEVLANYVEVPSGSKISFEIYGDTGPMERGHLAEVMIQPEPMTREDLQAISRELAFPEDEGL